MENQIQNQELKTQPSSTKKPFFGIDTIAWLLIIGASFQLLGSLLFVDLLNIILRTIGIIVGIGLLKRKTWALYGYIIFAMVGMGSIVYYLLLAGISVISSYWIDIISVIILIFFTIYLLKRKDQFIR
ncbi:MAG: hypothetical protein ACD_58C00120G0007 [uncultured bacterium]|nr:MAG: hypothetical protein ACD_58C00120G0007 [uncultured bacterium]